MANISIDRFSDAIEEELKLFGKDVSAGVNKAAQKATKDAVNDLKKNSPKRTGRYAGSWASKKESNAFGEDTYTIYNKNHYRLTHLLENGHINKKTGMRVSAIPHIASAEEAAINEFLNALEEMDL